MAAKAEAAAETDEAELAEARRLAEEAKASDQVHRGSVGASCPRQHSIPIVAVTPWLNSRGHRFCY